MRTFFFKTKTFFFKRATMLLVLFALAVQLVFAAVLYQLATSILEIQVAKDTHWWTPWIPVVAVCIATIGALITLYTNKRLSERQFAQRQTTEQDRFDRQSLGALYTDISNRFAAQDQIVRAGAAIRLAEMARKNWPGASQEKTPNNYPFFLEATSQLAASLHMEENRAVRDEVVKALNRMTAFDRQDGQQLRASAAGIKTKIGNHYHTFRATGITTYLKNKGTLEHAQTLANHASPRTTKLYDRRSDEISLDEVEKISI